MAELKKSSILLKKVVDTNEIDIYLNELLSLVFECLPFPVHDGFQFFEMSKLDLQLLHLGLDQKCNQTLDLSLFNGS
jgi:hypothetical protein